MKKGALQRFLATYSSSSTVKSYTWCLEKYFRSVYRERGGGKKSPKLEELAERYFNEKRDYQDDITSFFSSINTSPPKTVALAMSAVRTFLSENDVELPEKFWRRLRRRKKGTRALSMERVPSNLQLRMIFSHLPMQARALYLVQESSGMRVGETLKLRLEDLDLDSDPARISLRSSYTKSGNPRIAFISSEAKEALVEWLKVRKSYSAGKRTSPSTTSNNQTVTTKKKDDLLLFPFSLNNAHVMWRNALRKAKLLLKDKATNRYTIHPHVLRKFFRTRMATLVPADVVEALMGHERYLTEVYRKYSEEDLAKFYKQGEPSILVFASADAEELGELRKQVEEKSKQLSEVVTALAVENTEQKERINVLEAKARHVESLEKNVAELREQLMKMGARQASFDAMVSAVLNPKDEHRKILSERDLAKIRELLIQRTK